VEGNTSNRDDDGYYNADKLEDREEKEKQKKTQVSPPIDADAAVKFLFKHK